MSEENKLNTLLHELSSFKDKLNDIILAIFNGTVYPFDLFLVGICNRLLNINSGYILAIKHEHFLCAAPLVRVQLDTLMRLNAANLVNDVQVFASEVLEGQQINRMSDKDGNKMFDGYLKQKLAEHLPWVVTVYDETSGFVHFSDKHIYSNLKRKNGRKVEFSISDHDTYIPVSLKIEATECIIEICKNTVNIIKGYAATKNQQKDDF